MEYLLLTGGVILVGAIVLVLAIQSLPKEIISTNLGAYSEVKIPQSDSPNDYIAPALVLFDLSSSAGGVWVAFEFNEEELSYSLIRGTDESLVESVIDFSNPGDGIAVLMDGITATSPFLDSSVSSGNAYYYRMKACDAWNNCAITSEAAMILFS